MKKTSAAGTKPSVLIADGCGVLVEAMADLLSWAGYQVQSTVSLIEAKDLVTRWDFDYIIADDFLKDGSGLDLLREVKLRNLVRPIFIMLSANTNVTPDLVYHLGAESFMPKPVTDKQLINEMKRLALPLENRVAVQPMTEPRNTIFSKCMCSFPEAERMRCQAGRGGAFFETPKAVLPLQDENVNFFIEVASSKVILVQGSGIVRWVRRSESADLPYGFGLEFQYMEKTDIQTVRKLIDLDVSIPYIPRSIHKSQR